MNVYTFPTQEEAQAACDQIWKQMQEAGVQDTDIYGIRIEPQITVKWDDPKQDDDGNWTVFVPEDEQFQIDAKKPDSAVKVQPAEAEFNPKVQFEDRGNVKDGKPVLEPTYIKPSKADAQPVDAAEAAITEK